MKRLIVATIVGGIVFGGSLAFGQLGSSSPYAYENSPYNYDNSPYNYKNSPYNYDNSPYKRNNERIIRDNNGNAWGYVVPKDDGGMNLFDRHGNRRGYTP